MTDNYWRLIPLIQASGSIQMAIDRWLLQQHQMGKSPPILRFYTWHPAAISLGYHQREYPHFWHDLSWQGQPLDIIRRPTGGRAVLHQGDLTYMVVTSNIPGNRLQVYQYICQFLIEGWRSLGVNLTYGSMGRGYIHNPSCFSTATGADLVSSEGYKLIGSAQLRRGKAILQHGSMILSQDSTLFNQIFQQNPNILVKLPFDKENDHLIEVIINALTKSASLCFNINLVTQPLSEEEWLEIRELATKI